MATCDPNQISYDRAMCCIDVIEVMFLCQMASVASNFGECPSVGRHRGVSDGDYNGTALSPDIILLRFKAVEMFLCVDANDARVRLKRIVSKPAFSRRVSSAALKRCRNAGSVQKS